MKNVEMLGMIESKTEFADYLCFSNVTTSLYEFRKWLSESFPDAASDARFLQFVEKFGGSKMSIHQKRLAKLLWLYRVATSYRKFMAHYRARRFAEGRSAEKHFIRVSKLREKYHTSAYETKVRVARKALADIIRATRWAEGLRKAEKRKTFMTAEDFEHLGFARTIYSELNPSRASVAN